MSQKILVAGGGGFIGSHVIVELVNSGHSVCFGDVSQERCSAIKDAVKKITGVEVRGVTIDFCDEKAVFELFESESFDSVIHLAGFKSVVESIERPIEYHHNNLLSSIVLCKAIAKYGITKILFSSSAAVYGDPEQVPIPESHPVSWAKSPYGNTKIIVEQILRDAQLAIPDLDVVFLRYFNPVGAHHSLEIGESPMEAHGNLMPYICQVAAGQRSQLTIFGNDYDTIDGTGVRDYIHVVDLAKGHVSAIERKNSSPRVEVFNLGTGKGTSVLEMVTMFEAVNKVSVPYVIVPRRDGDVASCWADPSLANRELGWEAKLGLEEMVRDSWAYHQKS